MGKFDGIINYKDIRESLELILSESRLTDYELDEVLESLDDAIGNNIDELTLGENLFDKGEQFKTLEKAYQMVRFNDEFDKEDALNTIEEAQEMLKFSTEEMNEMTEEVNNGLF